MFSGPYSRTAAPKEPRYSQPSPASLKEAIIKPILKKNNLDPSEYMNFRPISNLPFLSKVIEKVIAAQLTSYVEDNNLCELFQSAYRGNHSTETTLIRVHNDIVMAIDKGNSAILVLLDLSAAFDTVDHSMLLSRLNTRFGICDKALDWFRSYLSVDALSLSRSTTVYRSLIVYPMVFPKVQC